MAKTFTKIGKEISISVKAGGPDPTLNSRLRAILQNAKAANMPKDNIERAIKKASSKDEADYKEMVYEGYGPYGIALIVETATDNTTRTVANVRAILSKAGGSLGTSGSVDFMFEHKSVFKIKHPDGFDPEEFELEMIDFGVEEVGADDEEVEIYGSYEAFGSIQKHLEEAGFELISSGFERFPMDTKKLDEAQEAEIEKMLGKLEDDDDVTNVFHNMG